MRMREDQQQDQHYVRPCHQMVLWTMVVNGHHQRVPGLHPVVQIPMVEVLSTATSGGTYEYCASGVNGNKKVSLWWTDLDNRCTSVPVDIYDGNTLIDTVYVNHQANGGKWNSLGTYTFSGTGQGSNQLTRRMYNQCGCGEI